MALDYYIFGKHSYGNVKTHTERQDCIVVRKIDSRVDNLGLNPGSTIYCGLTKLLNRSVPQFIHA